jgi:tetratricopeptide (TPR) repeat protein
MSKTLTKMIAVLGATSLLAGCQTFSQFAFGKNDQFDAKAQQQNSTLFTKRGTEHLRAGSNGLAIEAFNLAIATGEEPAPAYNGLGVAYARLDRPDLAYRFFKKATMGAPDNPVFARNLALLLESPTFAAVLEKQRRVRAAQAEAATQVPLQSALAAKTERSAGKLYRDSNGQFSLVTIPAPTSRADLVSNGQTSSCPAKKQSAKDDSCGKSRLPQTGSRTKRPGDLAASQLALPSNADSTASADPAAASSVEAKGKPKTVVLPVAANRPPAKPKAQASKEAQEKGKL